MKWKPPQFGLRTLLAATLAVACFFGGWRAREWKLMRDIEASREASRANVLQKSRIDIERESIKESQRLIEMWEREAASRNESATQ